ncbi:MAG: DUF2306 domain-containing protein [Myxococcota bacterium]
MAAGVFRVSQLIAGADITPENARFFAAPVPVVLHVVSAVVLCLVGAFQFAPGFRRRRLAWHRKAGRVLTVCGLAAGGTGLWMTVFYPHVPGDSEALHGMRLLFGSAMVASFALGFMAIREGDIARHGAWMTRGYAIGMGAGTQALVHLPWLLVSGMPDELGRTLLMGAGWLINLAVAEWSIRTRPSSPLSYRQPPVATPDPVSSV